MILFKNAISPVVATALLLIVAVIAVVGFQGWFQTFSSNLFVDIEQQGSISKLNVGIEALIGDKLYFKAGENTEIISVSIDGIDCPGLNGSYSGLENLNVSACISSISSQTPEIVIVTNNGIISETVFISEISGSSSTSNLPSFNFLISCASNPDFNAGDGTHGNPYQICSCSQLQNISNFLTANFTLISDIDCSDTINWNFGEGFNPIGCGWSDCGTRSSPSYFSGNLDGNNFTIVNLFINRTNEDFVGLFGNIEENNITNLNVISTIFGKRYVGGLIGSGSNSILSNIFVSTNVQGTSYVGGLSGSGNIYYNKTGSFSDVLGGYSVGGLVGISFMGIVESYSYGNVSGNSLVGGLVGQLYSSDLDNSYSLVNVVGNEQVGGLVGVHNSGGTVENSYSYGNVSGSIDVGGLIGANWGGNSINSYWDINTSGQLISSQGTGLTTNQMFQESSYSGWNFINIWTINEGNDYPRFQWE